MGDGRRWPQPTPSERAILYGNPYYSVVRPGRRTLLFNEWGLIGFNKGFVNYPSFVDAKSGYIIVSERDNHRLQIFDNVGNPSRFDRYCTQYEQQRSLSSQSISAFISGKNPHKTERQSDRNRQTARQTDIN